MADLICICCRPTSSITGLQDATIHRNSRYRSWRI